MTKLNDHFFSEDELRAKVIYCWLKDCGFSETQIKIEFSIKIKLGRNTHEINSRTDILVRSNDGRNLLIVETKKPDHKICNSDILQGISYARSLADGGIAPFTIITNGKQTLIYDSITSECLNDNHVQKTHPVIQNNFLALGDTISARYEGLNYLISLSEINFLSFCNDQVNYRMSILKDQDPFSGKKYIPSLYINRDETIKELEEKINKESIVLIIGEPQNGKTCFICNAVELFLSKKNFCIFYPAISLHNGLLKELAEDFYWNFSENITSYQIINRIKCILEKLHRDLYIFIDGWNEQEQNAINLNEECQRLKCHNIKIILSTTTSSLKRLLKDSADNMNYIGNNTKLTTTDIDKLATSPLLKKKYNQVVEITNFNQQEFNQAVKKYSKIFNVEINKNLNLFYSPFYLRLASEQYTNDKIPDLISKTSLINYSLIRKAARRNINEFELFKHLKIISTLIIKNDAPFHLSNLSTHFINNDFLSRWVECAILTHFSKKDIPVIDFYYTHERNFSIAILHRELHEKFKHSTQNLLIQEFEYFNKTDAGLQSFKWFWSCPEYFTYLKTIFNILDHSKLNSELYKILVEAILFQSLQHNVSDSIWLENYLNKITKTDIADFRYNEELSIMIYTLLLDIESKTEKFYRWLELLIVSDSCLEKLNIYDSYVFKILENKWSDNIKGWTDEDSESTFDDDLFYHFLSSENEFIVKRISIIFAYCKPLSFLQEMSLIISKVNNKLDFKELLYLGCQAAFCRFTEIDECDMYCPPSYDAEEEIFYNEFDFNRLKSLWDPVIKLLSLENTELFKDIVQYLKVLYDGFNDDKINQSNMFFDDPNQLKISFDK